MIQVTIHEAQANLSHLIEQVLQGEVILIVRDQQPVARLVAIAEARPARRIGGAAHVFIAIAPDYDEPLAEYKNYMP